MVETFRRPQMIGGSGDVFPPGGVGRPGGAPGLQNQRRIFFLLTETECMLFFLRDLSRIFYRN
jgi:hypothetical protein